MEITDSVVIKEVSDSNSSTNLLAKSKRTSRHKGVVLQQNGHYGCQIYANHQRIWLGTFKSEEEAIMAYDSASLKLRGSDSPRNFPFTEATAAEIKFQSCHSNEAVVNMIKDGSYQSKFADFLKMSKNVENELDFKASKMQNNHGVTYKQMFQKELTPSDVGKLNRLVIPKKYATKFFPQAPQETEENLAVDNPDDVQLSFYDNSMKLWKFRYCYWKSSQSYVFTRGWNRFVKEKQLKANDIVSFSLQEFVDNVKGTRSCFMIDVIPGENDSSGMSALTNHSNDMEEELQLHLKASGPYNVTEEADVREEREHDEQENKAGRKRVKLFGVQIN